MDNSRFQEDFYGEDVDYAIGSPHLADRRLRERLVNLTRSAIIEVHDRGLPLNILEIGAGHGGYTEPMLAMGCRVTGVEMSRASANALAQQRGGRREAS